MVLGKEVGCESGKGGFERMGKGEGSKRRGGDREKSASVLMVGQSNPFGQEKISEMYEGKCRGRNENMSTRGMETTKVQRKGANK